MQTLLDRMDRARMYYGLEARIPFADHRLVEYVYNVPWDMKYRNKTAKSLLREAFRDLLPEAMLLRRKNPYPKTYHPNYRPHLFYVIGKALTIFYYTYKILHEFSISMHIDLTSLL